MGVIVAMIGVIAWYFAAPFAFGFVATALDSTATGVVTAGVVTGVAVYLALKVIARCIRRMQGTANQNNGEL